MVKLPKSIIKKYGITKKAWEVFRKSRGGKQKKTAHRAKARKKSGTPSRKTEKGESKMAKRRKRIRHSVKRAGRKVRHAMETKPGKLIAMAAEAAAGGVLTSLVVNKAPMIKDQSRMVKSAAQGGLGLLAVLFVKNKHVKSLGAGAMIAAIMGVAKQAFNVEPLAGPSEGRPRLTPSEMARITKGQMNIPLPGTMGVPMSTAPSNAGFSRNGFGG
jgi:hypothetical protein